MLRLRRYRMFLICAILITVVLVRLSRTRQWEGLAPASFEGFPSSWDGRKTGHAGEEKPKRPTVDIEKPAPSSVPASSSFMQEVVAPSKASLGPTQTAATVVQFPKLSIPDRKLAPPAGWPIEEYADGQIHEGAPGRGKPFTVLPAPTPIHWEKQIEHFPVPTESIIQLPTGSPIQIPKIQHAFADETPDAKIEREARLEKVKEEFKRAWHGYKTHAWMHDELSPVSGEYQDPFCGWAATLVDSLDTLWIMGLEEDFEEAVRAVGDIDFTRSKRADIPVFETTIRYLGGLLAAYDVSGGNQKILLDKAVELGEVLMGAFDTPNRMPVLFYRWKPAFASQPHRASSRASLAELGSLSMEFTRLAQLTKEPKYYDAVARITNALEEWQNRGTRLEGVFPDDVDTTGCKHSASATNDSLSRGKPLPDDLSTDAKGYVPPMLAVVKEPKPRKYFQHYELEDLELSVIPGQPSKGHIQKVEKEVEKSDAKAQMISEETVSRSSFSNGMAPGEGSFSQKDVPNSVLADWECVPQGLDSPNHNYDTFSMGGGQDSTYEYFSKQYLLLGGLEDKYHTMYLKSMDAVRKYMLYRPMVPGDRDILFSGKVTMRGDPGELPTIMFNAYVTHLTCFIGGMVGMGAKIFKLDSDIDIAKKLSDGCVWAYESMSSGIMPESSEVLACGSVVDCTWNETAWFEALDPAAARRDEMIKQYDINKAQLEAHIEADRLAAQGKLIVEDKDTVAAAEAERLKQMASGLNPLDSRDASGFDVDSPPPVSTHDEDGNASSSVPDSTSKSNSSLHKPQVENKVPKPPPPSIDNGEEQFQKKLEETQSELDATAPGREVQSPSSHVPQLLTVGNEMIDPMRPLNHKEFVEGRIEHEGLPPGFVRIQSDHYILRPEAIESVWYMYRITGDTQWQDKGWTMFEHIINATRTTYGHSGITSVTDPLPQKLDEMQSFWLSETLKYFYLLYSTPDMISLDEWVLTTEAHPFKRPL